MFPSCLQNGRKGLRHVKGTGNQVEGQQKMCMAAFLDTNCAPWIFLTTWPGINLLENQACRRSADGEFEAKHTAGVEIIMPTIKRTSWDNLTPSIYFCTLVLICSFLAALNWWLKPLVAYWRGYKICVIQTLD